MTFNILTDSTADLDEKWAQENKVELVGLTITLDDITYETVGPNRLTSDRLLERSSKRTIDNSVCSISLIALTISSRPIDCFDERT